MCDVRAKLQTASLLALLAVAPLACSDAQPSAGPDAAATTNFDTGALELGAKGDVEPEAASADAKPQVDAPPEAASVTCPGGGGCACLSHADCDAGLCLDDPAGAQGKACAHPCASAACPADYVCAAVNGPGGDIANVCVWKWGKLCDPCATSADCTAPGLANTACVDQGQLGRFCGVACLGTKTCPDGYQCQPVATVEGGQLDQCVRIADAKQAPFGVCSCGAQAIAKKLQTACYVETKGSDGKFIGKCPGTRGCGETGLSICSAQQALPELCNGQDDDCDGQTDETDCEDGNLCTKDNCAGASGCKHVALDGTPCDNDGSVCTKNDTCNNGACIKGAVLVCNDGNDCTLDSCDLAKGCTQVADDGAACSDDNACTTADNCKGGQCQAGKPKVCEALNNCTLAQCTVATGKCDPLFVATGTPCNDGTACTGPDMCTLGTCGGKPTGCDDKNPCTTDSCDSTTGCKSGPSTAPCDDGNFCTDKDTCSPSGCSGTPIGVATACNDNSPCTTDSCEPAKGCVHGPTNDGGLCTSCGEIKCKCSVAVCKPDCIAIDGIWSDYTWSECTVKCGGGTQQGKRTCNVPAPSCGGKFCTGLATAVQPCNLQACPPPEFAKGTTVFDKPGQVFTSSVPVGVSSIQFWLWGGGGGGGMPGNGGGGGYVNMAMPVKAGDTVEVRVAEGGPPGGGAGASYVFKNGTFFALAGGGGGAGVDGCSGCTGIATDGAGGGGGSAGGQAQNGTANNKYSTNCGGGSGGSPAVGGKGGVCADKSPYLECIVTGGDGAGHIGGAPALGSGCKQGSPALGYNATPSGGQNGAGGGGGSGWQGGGGGGGKWTYTGGGGGGGASWVHGDGTVLKTEAASFEVPGGMGGQGYKAGVGKGGKGHPAGSVNAVEPGGGGMIVVNF